MRSHFRPAEYQKRRLLKVTLVYISLRPLNDRLHLRYVTPNFGQPWLMNWHCQFWHGAHSGGVKLLRTRGCFKKKINAMNKDVIAVSPGQQGEGHPFKSLGGLEPKITPDFWTRWSLCSSAASMGSIQMGRKWAREGPEPPLPGCSPGSQMDKQLYPSSEALPNKEPLCCCSFSFSLLLLLIIFPFSTLLLHKNCPFDKVLHSKSHYGHKGTHLICRANN